MVVRIRFLPSLQHIAIVKIAVSVYYSPRIVELINELQELEEVCEDTHEHRVQEKWTQVEKEVKRQFHNYLPYSFLKEIGGILRPLHSEVMKWKLDHGFVTSIGENYKRILIWNSEGTINRSKTAEEFIRSGTVDIHERFLMACTYFMEYDILNLWAEMRPADKRKLFSENANLAVRFWTDYLREGAIPSTWHQIANESLDPINIWDNDYRIRLSCFFDKIEPFVRRSYFEYPKYDNEIHHDDIRFCLDHMDGIERIKLFNMSRYDRFSVYLDWPLQKFLPKLLDNISSNIFVDFFDWAITYILSNKIRKGWKDADYVKILREIWNRVPPFLERKIKKTKVYEPLMIVLNYEKNQPFSIQEILESYFE